MNQIKGGIKMKGFLSSLVSFAHSMGGLVVVVILAVWQLNPLSFGNFNFSVGWLGGVLSSLIVAFAIVWSQYKQRYLLAHLILTLIFASAVSQLFNSILGLNFGGTGFIESIITTVAFLYVLGVVLGELLVAKPKLATYPMAALFSLLLFGIAVYLVYGFGTLLLALVPIVLALLLGSRLVALLYAGATLVAYVFSNLSFIISFPSQYEPYVLLLIFGAALVFIGLDLYKAFKNQEA